MTLRCIQSADTHDLGVHGDDDGIHLDIDRQIEREMEEALNAEDINDDHTNSKNINPEDDGGSSSKYKSELKVEFGRLDVFVHDETVSALPKIFSFGFHNFSLCAVSASPSTLLQRVTVNMLWHSNKHYKESWSPLVCPWNCQFQCVQLDNPATSIVIEGKHPLDVFVSDVVIRGFVQNAMKWIDAFKIDTAIPDAAEVQQQFIESTEDGIVPPLSLDLFKFW